MSIPPDQLDDHLWFDDNTARVKMVITLAVDLAQWDEAYGLDHLTDREIRDHVREHAAFTMDAALADEGNGARVRPPEKRKKPGVS